MHRLKYIHHYKDRHGKARWYFRAQGMPKIALPGMPHTTEFMDVYARALGDWQKGRCIQKKVYDPALDTRSGTMAALIDSYFRSASFRNLKPVTQTTYRNLINRYLARIEAFPVQKLDRKKVLELLERYSDTPDKPNRVLKILKVLMKHALEIEMITNDPTQGIRKRKTGSSGFETWSEEHIARFYRAHPAGSRAHLAMDLLLLTGQRRQDIVTLGPNNISGDSLLIKQSKTGSEVFIPIDERLQRIIASLPPGQRTFLVTEKGAPMKAESFTNWFRECVKDAGLPNGLSPHGLRKAVCRRLAEAGATEHEIMAITGHRNIKEVSTYTAAADRAKLAKEAMTKIAKSRKG